MDSSRLPNAKARAFSAVIYLKRKMKLLNAVPASSSQSFMPSTIPSTQKRRFEDIEQSLTSLEPGKKKVKASTSFSGQRQVSSRSRGTDRSRRAPARDNKPLGRRPGIENCRRKKPPGIRRSRSKSGQRLPEPSPSPRQISESWAPQASPIKSVQRVDKLPPPSRQASDLDRPDKQEVFRQAPERLTSTALRAWDEELHQVEASQPRILPKTPFQELSCLRGVR